MHTTSTIRALVFTALATSSSALRGGSNKKTPFEVVHTDISHRHLLPSNAMLDCVLYKRGIEFEDKTSQEDWCCAFSPEQQQNIIVGGGQDMICIDGITKESLENKGAMSGESLLKIKNAFVEVFFDQTKETKLVIAEEDAEVEALPVIDRRHARQRRRNLASSKAGTTLRTLVVRVIDASGSQIAADRGQLKDDVFDDTVCLKSQYAACSHNQLIIEPASNIGDGTGIVDVNLDIDAYYDTTTGQGNSAALEQAALTKVKGLYGTGNNADGHNGLTENFDLIIFCQPPGSGSWIAYAYVNGWTSFYNNHWCQKVSAQMHEVGHNLNLAHSGAPGNNPSRDQYEDSQGLMGYSFNSDDGPKMCFNPAKNFQLGWYDDQLESINPLDLASSPQTFTFNGVDDYNFGKTDALISLRLEDQSIGGKDYYIGFNKASGINSGTVEARNSVTVLVKESGSPTQYGKSTRLASLSKNGDTYKISNWAGSIFDVFISLDSIIDGKDAIVTVSTSEPFPTQAPTSNCDSLNGRFKLDLTTDNFGAESTWTITQDSTQEIVYQGENGYFSNQNFILPEEYSSYCLEEGECYTFTMIDGYGDGICCGYGNGGYKGFLNGELEFSGGTFGKEQKHAFCVSESKNEEPQTSSPTRNPTMVPTTLSPSSSPIDFPSSSPSISLTMTPTSSPTKDPTDEPSASPTKHSSLSPSIALTMTPTDFPTASLTNAPTDGPSNAPTDGPSNTPSVVPTGIASSSETKFEDISTESPSFSPSSPPSIMPSIPPTDSPTKINMEPTLAKCEDKMSRIKLKFRGKTRNWTCQKIKQKRRCKKKQLDTGIPVWSLCPVSCKNGIPSKELQNLSCMF